MARPTSEAMLASGRRSIPDGGGSMPYRRLFSSLLFAAALATTVAVAPGAAAQAETSYTMELSPATATIQPGGTTSTTVSFYYTSHHLHGARVDLSVTDLPCGITASFSPPRPRIDDTSTLTITATPSSPTGPITLTVSAITEIYPSDPIGTTTPFGLTIG